MSITLVTTTRDRAFCFGLLEKWVSRQTLQPDQWLVINDSPGGMKQYKYTCGQEVHYRRNRKEQLHSLCENWLAALPRIQGEKVLVAEDDDWLHPSYLETVAKLLDGAELAGVCNDLYFNLRNKTFRRCHNLSHASLGATGFRRCLLPMVREVAKRGSIFLDMALWDEVESKKLVDNKAPDGRAYHVGLKGMPGCPGLGLGHDGAGSTDTTLTVLTKWIGVEDTRVYRSIPAAARKEAV